jgi:hypothetical protein
MKKIYSVIAGLLLTASVWAQAPQKMSYQGVIRNSSNALLTSTPVGMQISILQGSSSGTAVYVETQTISTNANGLVSLEIGSGTIVTGTFAGINWATGPYFIKTETDPLGGTAYTIVGTNELMSVPYALFSANGTPGAVGSTGATGAAGTNGVDGAVGATGAAGTNGVDGAVGATGAAGTNGTNGAVGATGAAGTNGTNGLVGATGAAGTNGTNGLVGATGAAGTNGTNGAVGATGLTGATGSVGATGGYPVHFIGESYGGGIVFDVYDGGQHGLIAATADQSTGIRWDGGSYTNTRARGDGVGAGLKNTAIIIANQGPVDGSSFAATVCNEYSVTVGGVSYGDWYLPSKHELNLLYLQKTVVGGFAGNVYWSSTETGHTSAWGQIFSTGSPQDGGKSNTDYVRAVRAF